MIAAGLPGSGKSTWFRQHEANPISSDAIRLQLTDSAEDQTVNGRVFEIAQTLLRHRLQIGRPITYIDATNLTRKDRRHWIQMAGLHSCRVKALWFDVPLAVCKTRNASRARMVPDRILDLMAARFVPPSCEEGFDEVVRISEPNEAVSDPPQKHPEE